MQFDYKALGHRVRRVRKKLKMTQEELAEEIGISHSFMGHIERGTRKLSVETLIALGMALQVSTDYLLGHTQETAIHNAEGSKSLFAIQDLLEKYWDYDV